MDSFKLLLQEVMQKPSVAGLQMICSQVEAWDNYMPGKVKEMAHRAITTFVSEGTLAAEEDLLRLYRILGKYSKKMGAAMVFEKLDETGRFTHSLKFHLIWAESYAKTGDLTNFSRVLNLAKNRLTQLSTYELESGFRDLADQYLQAGDIFNDEEETMACFNIKKSDLKAKRSRRRSSLAVIEARAKDTFISADAPKTASFGPNTRTKLRFELIDRPNDSYIAPSLEEFRAAMVADEQMADGCDIVDDVPMDITVTQPETMIIRPHPQSIPESKEHGKRNRILETVVECDSDFSNDDKRRRVLSPTIPTRESVFSSRMQKSSPPPKESSAATRPPSTSEFLSGSSFTEKAYSDMKAMFSDTVVISKGGLPGITDETTLPVAAPAVEAFEVYVDDDLSQRTVVNSENIPREVNFPRQSEERIPLQPISVRADSKAIGDAKDKNEEAVDRFDLPMESMPLKSKKQLFIEDEETIAGAKFTMLGIDKKLERGIVTSTPAHPLTHPPTHEDFFAPLNHVLEEQMKKEQDEEEIYAQSTFVKRRSIAPPKTITVAPKPSVARPRTVQAAERSMELALDKMKIGDSQEVEPNSECDVDLEDHDKTGVGLVDEAVTSVMNPWDRQLRCEILKKSHKPCYQHEFDTTCPRVAPGKSVNFGGEVFNIVELVGQGGFAKVYKCTNEEKRTLALKYEIPPCPWEVYICSEVKMRIDRSKQFILDSVMEVTEAYVFTNASVLFNQYHPHGTLLDLSNKWTDPSWYIVALIAIQIAKILRELHAVKIIHADIKPDNFMILGKLSDSHENIEKILSTPILKLIDWGRAIDMRVLAGHTFTGRAGTEKFDCSEMLDGRPWTYQTDYFGYVGTLHVFIQGKYAEIVKQNGIFKVNGSMKRRLAVREVLEATFIEFLNIPDCEHMPSWDVVIHKMEKEFGARFSPMEWRQAVARFNSFIP
ncbi:hypothetical protein RB195_010698 [Necator americanus]|uniref:Protein kinase domain-containing protein n=1 Tax=Necator americanus TaxID=51031 RepID=A0ABR1D0E2_NECAM